MKHFVFASAMNGILLAVAVSAIGADSEPVSKDVPPAKTTKGTYLISGLHCPPCTTTVEKSVKGMKGVQSVKVDWSTKDARIEFDEQQVSVQQIAKRISSTAHMMGGKMQYAGWLALKVPEITAEGNAEKVKSALTKIEGVSTVITYPKEKSVGVAFSEKGNITTTQLVKALKDVGIDATVIP